jgi:hypothetical protein
MPWNDAIEQEYDDMLRAGIWQVLGYPSSYDESSWLYGLLKWYIRFLETGSGGRLNVTPANHTYLTNSERIQLHLKRIACCLYTERMGIWPWKLRDKNVTELEPLLHRDWQGFYPFTASNGDICYYLHGTWDVRPEDRMTAAILGYSLMAIIGDAPRTEREFVIKFIQNMRDSGWYHMGGNYDVYVDGGYTDYGYGTTWDFDDIAEVKASGCHLTATWIVSALRPFNIPAHIGFERSGRPSHRSSRYGGHCILHFPTLGWWTTHADDVLGCLHRSVPPQLCMKSESWMQIYKDARDYNYWRAASYDDYFKWCLFIGRCPNLQYDVPHLFYSGQLRNTLETIHIIDDFASLDGAPEVVPPLFTDAEIDFLMTWVDDKLP